MALADTIAGNTLAVVLAGGSGSRLAPLTQHICKPALPFAGVRSIDFSLSNCINSGVRTIGVPTQYKPRALLAHLASAWSAAASDGAVVQAWRADERAPRLGYRGTADAVYRNLDLIDELGHCLVLVLAGDHVYRMDYRPMLEAHCASGAAVTLGCVDVPVRDARHFGVLDVADDGRIRHFVEKPGSRAALPGATRDTVLASMGIYVFDADFLARILTLDAFTAESKHDFGIDILPRLIASGARAFAHPFRDETAGRSYWRDIGTLGAYYRAHMELLDPSPPLRLNDPRWPIGTVSQARCAVTPHATTTRGGSIERSLLAAPRAVAGHIRRSVILEGAEVGEETEVVESIVMPGATVGPRSYLRGVIVGAGHHVPEDTVIDHSAAEGEPLVLASNGDEHAMPYAVAH